MGFPLAFILSNIIMTRLESTIVKELFDQSFVQFYMKYDHTLLLVREKGINLAQKSLNSFNKNNKFTVDTFQDEKVYFLDNEIVNNNAKVYQKLVNISQYINFHSQTPWTLKTAWNKSINKFAVLVKILIDRSFIPRS